ncbi:MAG TPA: ABC transporter permease [Anaerolineaceae bacterium]|nr:ABC transporter permease [Anaerolineaceae bacterium]
MDQQAQTTHNPYLEIWQRLRKNKLAIISLAILAVFVLLALTADVWFDYQSVVIKQDIPNRLQAPGPGHPFGTDQYGRDLLARIVHGARYSLSIGVIAVALAVIGGCVLGGISGYYSGLTDSIIMRFVDIMLSIPPILLCISIVAALGPGMVNLMIALVIANTPGFTRLVRASVLTVKDMEYVEAARAIGLRDFRIIFKYVLLNCMGPILVNATMGIAGTILTAAGLSFIGLGVQPPSPEWGAMLSGGRQYLRAAPHILFFPGAAIVIAVLCINFIGDGLRDALDPKLKD